MSVPAPSAASWNCVVCRAALTDEYWTVGTKVVCPACKARIDARPMTPLPQAAAMSVAFGLGAAIVASALWAAILLGLGLQLGIAAIAVGWAVGRAVMKGAGTRSGLPFQALAMTLTICSLAWSLLPLIVRSDAFAGAGLIGQIAALTAGPFLFYAKFIASDPLTLLFVGIALWEAWRLNRPRTIPFTGPHRMAGAIDFTAR